MRRIVSIVVAAGVVVLGASYALYYRQHDSRVLPAAVTPAPAPTCSLDPRKGISLDAAFTITCSDVKDYSRIAQVGLLVNNFSDGAQGCYVVYLPQQREIRLVSDDGSKAMGREIDSDLILENSACTFFGKDFEVLGRGKVLSVKFNLKFKPAFAGVKNLFVLAQSNEGASTGLELHGVWRVRPRSGEELTRRAKAPEQSRLPASQN
jgi:hypothetical protein